MSFTMKIKNTFAAGALFCALALLAGGCGGGRNDAPDVSKIKVQLSLRRFDRDLFALDTNNLKPGLEQLFQAYPDFLPFFFSEVIHDQTNPKETPEEALAGFVKAPQVRRLNDSCQAAFPDLSKLEPDLTQVLRYYKYYFPQKPTPKVVTAVTEFVGDAAMASDSVMMIGLDFFLGENFSGYNPDAFPYYFRRQFKPEYLPVKVSLALASRAVGEPPGDHILDYMINNGKILYLVDHLAPAVPDSMIMNYTKAQAEEAVVNEQRTWARLLELKVLYEPLNSKNRKIVEPSPDTQNVFTEAPGEIGNWIGWQIVKAYMERHPKTTLPELLNFRDSQQFLEKAKYKPKRN